LSKTGVKNRRVKKYSLFQEDKTDTLYKKIYRDVDSKEEEHTRPFWKRDWRK